MLLVFIVHSSFNLQPQTGPVLVLHTEAKVLMLKIGQHLITSARPSLEGERWAGLIGVSLSEPHTSGTALHGCVCIRTTDRACGHIP